jgi:CRISPR-associated protein Csx17
MVRLVRALGALEMVLAHRDPGKAPQLPRPLGGLGFQWVPACGDDAEVRIAAALASIAPTGSAGPLRSYLAPLDPRDPHRYAPAPRALAWTGTDLADRLASVLQRRLLDVRTHAPDESSRRRNPTWGSRHATLDEVATFLTPGLLDDSAIEELLFGFSWVKHARDPSPAHSRHTSSPLPRAYALLKLLFLADDIPRPEGRIRLTPDPAIVPRLRTGRVTEAVDIARRQLAAIGLRPRRVVDDHMVNATLGRRLAAALLIPVAQTSALLEDALLPNAKNATDDHEEKTNAR